MSSPPPYENPTNIQIKGTDLAPYLPTAWGNVIYNDLSGNTLYNCTVSVSGTTYTITVDTVPTNYRGIFVATPNSTGTGGRGYTISATNNGSGGTWNVVNYNGSADAINNYFSFIIY